MLNRLALFKERVVKPAYHDVWAFELKTIMLAKPLFFLKHINDVCKYIANGDVSQNMQDDARAYTLYHDLAIVTVFLGSLAYHYFNTRVDYQQNTGPASARPR